MSLYVEFNSAKPETIETRVVETDALEGLVVPLGTLSFNFYRKGEEGIPELVSPVYFLSLRPDVFRTGQLLAHFPAFAEKAAGWSRDFDVHEFGLVSYVLEGNGFRGALIIPLMDTTVLLDRDTLAQKWPRLTA